MKGVFVVGLAGLRRELCLPFNTLSSPGAAERRGRLQADMSLTLRVKYFQLSVKCKGEKITKVDFRGEYRQSRRNLQFRSTIFRVSLIEYLLLNGWF
jgi:hypothetical protein